MAKLSNNLQGSGGISPILSRTRLISSDSHIVEPPNLWDSLESELGDRRPHVITEEDGDWWYIDGKKTMSFLGINVGKRFEVDSHELRTSGTFDQVAAGASDPDLYIKENEQDGIWASVIYPSQGLILYAVPNSEVATLAMRRYNDWIADFCATHPDRLKGIGMLNVDDIDEAVNELKRCRKLGLVGAMISVAPPAWGSYRLPEYDQLWAVAQDLDFPLSLHIGTDRADPRIGDAAFRLDVKHVPPSSFVNSDYRVRITLADFIYSGVFERFQNLKVGAIEFELSWIPVYLHRLDYAYTDRPPRGPEWRKFEDPNKLPSDFFKSNIFISFQEDPYGLRLRDVYGIDGLLWGSDYPHTESTFPRSLEILDNITRGMSEIEIEKIVNKNVRRIYNF
ncbi:amidohydrolase family protein [Croceicoccus estronivorus]|uniref:amidohydrolase family protein n=1 Tax=Croceicoccus estronivorus TaxID=1172626 RepID=UPI000B292DBB|nr:amidohydrolase family protein [Croceicoccus estronivorus]